MPSEPPNDRSGPSGLQVRPEADDERSADTATAPSAPRKGRSPSDDACADGSLVGAVLNGTYRLTSVLGSGSMGVVYEAIHARLETRFAVKVLGRSSLDREHGLERFWREARAASTIEHDNIVQVIDFKVAPTGQPYIVMEYLQGQSLRDALQACGRFPLQRACIVVAQVLDALGAAHDHGIVHRDLKPANVFLTSKFGREDVVKLLDFGVSKLADDTMLTTTEGTLLGTPAYMAPEQIRMEQKADHRADVYAAGVVLYELLTGKRPFVRRRVESLLYEVLESAPTAPRELVPDLPRAVEAVILGALEKEPGDRFQTAREMLDALQAAVPELTLCGSTSAQRPTPLLQRTAHKRSRARLAWVGALVLLGSVALVLTLRSRREPTRVTSTPNASTSPLTSLTPSIERKSREVAVLPFENESERAELDWLSTGVAHTVASELDRVKGLGVVGSQRVSHVVSALPEEVRADPHRVGTALGVDWLVSGSYQVAGDELRVIVRPYRVGDAESLRPVTVRGPMVELFDLQDKVVLRTAEVLRVELEQWDSRRLARQTTDSLDAYRVFSTAMRACDQTMWLACFAGLNRAIEIDDRYAWAYAQRGIRRYWQSGYADFDRNNLAQGASDLRHAAELQPDLARYRAYEALIHAMLGNYAEADSVIDALAQSRPEDPMVLLLMGHVFAGSTLVSLVFDELPRGVRAYQRFIETEPCRVWVYVNLCERYLSARMFDRALEMAQAAQTCAVRLNLPGVAKEHPPVYAVLEGLARDGAGDRARALVALEAGVRDLDDWGTGLYSANLYRWLAHTKLAQMSKGRGDSQKHAARAAELEKALVRQHPLAPGSAYQHPLVDLMLLVEPDRAIELIRRDEQAAPADPLAPLFVSSVLVLDGRFAEAEKAARRAQDIARDQPELTPYIERRLARCKREELLSTSLSP